MNRREFLGTVLRGSALTALAGGGAVLASRTNTNSAKQSCINKSICKGCSQYSGCGLPRALSIKKKLGGKNV